MRVQTQLNLVAMLLTCFSQVEVLIFRCVLENKHRTSHWIVVCTGDASSVSRFSMNGPMIRDTHTTGTRPLGRSTRLLRP